MFNDALNAGMQMLDAKYGELGSTVENRLTDMEARIDFTQAQVAKLDELLQHLHAKHLKKLKARSRVRWNPLCGRHQTGRKMLTKHP